MGSKKALIVKPEEVLERLIENVRAAFVETSFSVHQTLIHGYHEIGSAIILHYELIEKSAGGRKGYGRVDVMDMVADAVGKSRRMIYHAVRFAEAYPDLNKLPKELQGKNATFSMIVNHLEGRAVDSREPKAKELEHPVKCQACGNTHNCVPRPG